MNKLMAATAAFLLSTPSYAGVCVSVEGDDPACVLDPSYDLEQVFMDAGTDVNELTGHLGSQTDPRTITFQSGDLISAAEGFAQITGQSPSGDPGFDDLTFFMTDPTLGMEAVTFDIRAGDATFLDLFWDSTDGSGSQLNIALANGLTSFLMIADPETLTQVSFQTTDLVDVANFKHLRIDPDFITPDPDPVGVDAPGHIALLSMGLLGLYSARKRKS